MQTQLTEIENALNHLYSVAHRDWDAEAFESFKKAMEALRVIELEIGG